MINLSQQLVELIDSGDPCSLLFFVVLLLAIGMRVVGTKPKLKLWAMRFGVVAFVGYLARDVWIYGIAQVDGLISATYRGLLAGGIVIGALSLLLPITVAVCWDFTLARLWQHSRMWWATSDSQHHPATAQQHEDNRDQQQREAERKQVLKQQHAESQRQRASARADLFRQFLALQTSVDGRFSEDHLKQYVTDFMGDEHPAEDVENRGRELATMLTELTTQPTAESESFSLEQLASWFVDQKQRIDELPLQDTIKQRLHAGLNVRYAELTEQLIQGLRP